MVPCCCFGLRFSFAFLLCLILGICRCSGHYIGKKLKLVKTGNCVCCRTSVKLKGISRRATYRRRRTERFFVVFSRL